MNIEYRPAKTEDCAGMLRVTDECINNEEEYRDYMRDLCARLGGDAVGVVALLDGVVEGLSVCVRGMELTGGREDFFPQIRNGISGEEIFSGAVVAVTQNLRGMGVGTSLQKRVMSAIRKMGGRHLLLEIWAHPDGKEPSHGSLKLAPSHTDYGVVPNFYDIPALAGHVCQICGSPCRCGARIAVLHLFPEIAYRPAEKGDMEGVLSLAANYIDPSPAYREYMAGFHAGLGADSAEELAFCGNKLVGMINARSGMHLTGERRDFFREIRFDIGDAVVWTAGFVVVDPEYQGFSIARELQTRLFAEMREMGVKYVLAEIWCRPDGYMPSRSLTACGSASVKEYGLVENFYADIPRPEGAVCQVCGENCRCNALISVIKL